MNVSIEAAVMVAAEQVANESRDFTPVLREHGDGPRVIRLDDLRAILRRLAELDAEQIEEEVS
jgi:hypothetical protein